MDRSLHAHSLLEKTARLGSSRVSSGGNGLACLEEFTGQFLLSRLELLLESDDNKNTHVTFLWSELRLENGELLLLFLTRVVDEGGDSLRQDGIVVGGVEGVGIRVVHGTLYFSVLLCQGEV